MREGGGGQIGEGSGKEKKESADKKFYSLLESGIELIGRLNMVASVSAENFADWVDIVNTSLVFVAREN